MRLVLALSLALLAVVANASDWQPLGPWGGTDLRLVAADPQGQRVYATSVDGLFRSDDRGATWISLSAPAGRSIFPGPAQLALTPADPDRVLAVFDRRYAYLSHNGGRSWRLLLDAQLQGGTGREEFGAAAIHPVEPSRLSLFRGIARASPDVVSFGFNVRWYRSEDAGASFTSRVIEPQGYAGTCLHVGLVATSAQYADGTDDEIVVSIGSTCPPIEMYDLLRLSPSRQDLITTAASGMPNYFQVPESSLQQTPERYIWLFGGSLSEIDAVSGDLRVVANRVTGMHLSADGRLWAATQDGLNFSDDLGATWTQGQSTGFGLGRVRARETLSIQSFSGGRILASNRESIFALNPGADTWQASAEGMSALPVHTLALAEGGRSIWAGLGWTVLSNQWYESLLVPTAEVLYRSTDGGENWQTSNIDRFARWLNAIVIDPGSGAGNSGSNLYAAGAACSALTGTNLCSAENDFMEPSLGLYRSRDAGSTWEALEAGLGPADYPGMRTLALNPHVGTPGSRSLLAGRRAVGSSIKPAYASTNSGAAWSDSSAGLFDPATAPGAEWPDVTMIRFSPARPGLVFATTRVYRSSGRLEQSTLTNGVFRSVDGGATWQHRSTGLPRYSPEGSHVGISAIAVHPTNAAIAWVLTEEQGATGVWTSRVFKTENEGLSWREQGTGLPQGRYWALTVEPQRPDYLYIGGAHGVFFSSSAGERWSHLGRQTLRRVRVLEIGADHVFAGSAQGVHRIPRPNLNPSPRPGRRLDAAAQAHGAFERSR